MQIGHQRVGRRIAGHDEHHGAFIDGTFQQLIEKPHRTGRVGQRDEARVMQCGEQQSGGDAHRFHGVVVRDARAIGPHAVASAEDGDQVRGRLEVRFVFVRPQRCQRRQPVARRRCVELPLRRFGCVADHAFHQRIADHHKVPRLLVRTARSGAGGHHAGIDHLAWHWTIAELPHRPTSLHVGGKRTRPRDHLVWRIFPDAGNGMNPSREGITASRQPEATRIGRRTTGRCSTIHRITVMQMTHLG